MGVDISLLKWSGTENEEEIESMNWLRNPFGLCNWAVDNYVYWCKKKYDCYSKNGKNNLLYHMLNCYAYDKGKKLDRKKFLEIVQTYYDLLNNIEEGYFFFDLNSYRQFIQPKYNTFLKGYNYGDFRTIHGEKYDKYNRNVLMIPQSEFVNYECVHSIKTDMSLSKYKAWMRELLDFAEMLQDESLEFYCST